jgi:hypothetical protein
MIKSWMISLSAILLTTVAFIPEAQAAWPAPAPNIGNTTPSESASPVIADIDGDGTREVVVVGQDGTVFCFQEDGTLLWQTSVNTGVSPSYLFQLTPTLADVDGNPQTQEIILATDATTTYTPQGGLQVTGPARVYVISSTGVILSNTPIGVPGTNTIVSRNVLVVDTDGNGANEIYVTASYADVNHSGIITAHGDFYSLNFNGTTNFVKALNGSGGGWAPMAMDTNGDGKLEVFTTQQDTVSPTNSPIDIKAWDYSGNLLWTYTPPDVAPTMTLYASPVGIDLNHNGSKEVVVAINGTIHALDSLNGQQLWQRQIGVFGNIAAADINYDGKPELVFKTGGNKVAALDGNGNQLWLSTINPALYGNISSGAPISIADLDED